MLKCKVVVIKVPLYQYDDNEEPYTMSDEDVEEVVGFIKGKDEVCGYCIGSIEVIEEDLDLG